MKLPEQPRDAHCIFCRIISGEIPAAKIFEDAMCVSFLDSSPIAPGHALVVPKGHYPTLLDVPDGLGSALTGAMRKVGKALMDELSVGGFSCVQNNFAPAGQVVFHVHWHIIPRCSDDGLPQWSGKPYPEQKAAYAMAERIAARLGKQAAL